MRRGKLFIFKFIGTVNLLFKYILRALEKLFLFSAKNINFNFHFRTMGVRKCSVINCENNSNSEGVHLFTTRKADILVRWRAANQVVGWRNVKSLTVCSDHFLESDLTFNKDRVRLKPSAVPSIFKR